MAAGCVVNGLLLSLADCARAVDVALAGGKLETLKDSEICSGEPTRPRRLSEADALPETEWGISRGCEGV